MKFLTKLMDNEASANWPAIMRYAAKYRRAIIDVREYDENAEISEKQRKYLHCKAGPIKALTRDGWSEREAKEHCKVEWGRKWFVIELTDDNCHKVEGVFRWECRKIACRKIIHPMDIKIGCDGDRLCPYCDRFSIVHPIALKSIMNVSVKNVGKWFWEMFTHFPKDSHGNLRIKQPDPKWRSNEKKGKA